MAKLTIRLIVPIALAALLCAGAFIMLRLRDEPVAAPVSPTPTATPQPSPTPAPTEKPLAVARIRAAGDIIIDTPMLEAAYSKGGYRFGRYFSRIADQLADADLTVVNVEGVLGGGDGGYSGYPSFNTPPSLLDALKKCGVDMLTLANNHALDLYYDGLMGTLKSVDKAGLTRMGAYRSQKDYDKPMVVEINGIKIGFTNYTTGLNGMEKLSDKRALKYGLRTAERADFKKDMQALRDAGAQAIVVFMHWDREYKHLPSEETQALAKKLVAAGADVIIGGHPHMVQPIEWVEAEAEDGTARRALVVYSLGNFLSNHKGEYLDNGIIFELSFELTEDGQVRMADPKYLPVWVWVQKDGDDRNYQVVPIGQTLDNRPEGMTDAQYERMKAAWSESVDLLGTEIAQPI